MTSEEGSASEIGEGVAIALPCCNCGRPLEGVSAFCNQPKGGTAFSSAGHYGSTVFDPMDNTLIEINLCDPCLTGLAGHGAVAHYSAPGGRDYERKLSRWAPTSSPTTGEGHPSPSTGEK